MLRALEYGRQASGKSWKGLERLTDLAIYSGVDPTTAECSAIFDTAIHAPVDYTHVPGREWIVRDYQIGRHLMQIDGKIAPGDRWAGLQQGRGSLSTGYIRAGQERTEFGRRYSKPLAAFLDSRSRRGPGSAAAKAFLLFTQAAKVNTRTRRADRGNAARSATEVAGATLLRLTFGTTSCIGSHSGDLPDTFDLPG